MHFACINTTPVTKRLRTPTPCAQQACKTQHLQTSQIVTSHDPTMYATEAGPVHLHMRLPARCRAEFWELYHLTVLSCSTGAGSRAQQGSSVEQGGSWAVLVEPDGWLAAPSVRRGRAPWEATVRRDSVTPLKKSQSHSRRRDHANAGSAPASASPRPRAGSEAPPGPCAAPPRSRRRAEPASAWSTLPTATRSPR